MAESYLEFSQVLPHLSAEEAQWLQDQLEVVHVIDGTEYTEDNLPENTDGAWIGCRAYRDLEDYDGQYGGDVGFEYALHEDDDEDWGHHLWLYSQDHAYLDRVAHLVQKFLRTFRPGDCWSLTYSATCSKPRVGEFGGGAVFVTASDVKWLDAWCLAEEAETEFDRRKGVA